MSQVIFVVNPCTTSALLFCLSNKYLTMKTNVNFSFVFLIYLLTFLWITVYRPFPFRFSWRSWLFIRSRNCGKRMRSCHWGIKLMDCRYPVYIVCYTTWTCKNWVKSNSLFLIFHLLIATNYLLIRKKKKKKKRTICSCYKMNSSDN